MEVRRTAFLFEVLSIFGPHILAGRVSAESDILCAACNSRMLFAAERKCGWGCRVLLVCRARYRCLRGEEARDAMSE